MIVYCVIENGRLIEVFSSLAGANDFINNIVKTTFTISQAAAAFQILAMTVNGDTSPSTNTAYKQKKGLAK